MDRKQQKFENLHHEYIQLNKRIMKDPKQRWEERILARQKVNQYLDAIRQLYKV